MQLVTFNLATSIGLLQIKQMGFAKIAASKNNLPSKRILVSKIKVGLVALLGTAQQ